MLDLNFELYYAFCYFIFYCQCQIGLLLDLIFYYFCALPSNICIDVLNNILLLNVFDLGCYNIMVAKILYFSTVTAGDKHI